MPPGLFSTHSQRQLGKIPGITLIRSSFIDQKYIAYKFDDKYYVSSATYSFIEDAFTSKDQEKIKDVLDRIGVIVCEPMSGMSDIAEALDDLK